MPITLDTIDAALDAVLTAEGWPTYSNRPADKGGPTKGGITMATLTAYRKRPVSIPDLQALSLAEARDIYRQQYIAPWTFVRDRQLFEALVDWAVTSWHDDPIKAVQRALGLTVDGILGQRTRYAIERANPGWLRTQIVKARIQQSVHLALNEPRFQSLIENHPELQVWNLRGWLTRALRHL